MKLIALFLTLACANMASGHTYHLGDCSVVEPMSGFEMDKFLGKWYAIQKTSTGSRCLIYNFSKMSEPNKYEISQVSDHPVLGLVKDNNYRYTGLLSVPSSDVPGKMKVNFPLSVAGSASFVVFMTDYNTYAGIYTCQKLGFAHRHSATILARDKSLDKVYIEKLRNRLGAYNVNPFDLSGVNQTDCGKGPDAVNIHINPDTFSPESIGNAVRKAGEKIGDGVEYVADGVKSVYGKIYNKNDNSNPVVVKTAGDREEIVRHDDNFEPNAEWLP